MSGLVSIRGALEVGGDICTTGCGGITADRLVKGLSLACEGSYFESAVATGRPLKIQTAGAVGAAFVDLDLLDELTAIEFLMLRSSNRIVVRIDPEAAVITGSGGAYPTSFSGGETLDLTIDGVSFTVTFQAGDQSLADVVARVNSAAALAGLATPRASDSGGQLRIESVAVGPDADVAVTGGTGAATLGMSGLSDEGTAEDVELNGLMIHEFPRSPDAPTRVQLSGSADVTVVAAGRSS